MLLDATLGPVREGLTPLQLLIFIASGVMQTLAISFQLFPASRIVFSLRSSAGVHGVFVRLFFAVVGLVLGSPSSAVPAPSVVPPGSPDPEADPVASAVLIGSTCLRFRDFLVGEVVAEFGAALIWLSD